MNHQEWIRGFFRERSQSFGFHLTSRKEIEKRLTRIRATMEKSDIEALLVIQKMDYYYLTGTTQDGLLFIPLQGKPLFMVIPAPFFNGVNSSRDPVLGAWIPVFTPAR